MDLVDYREVADSIFNKLPFFSQATALDKKIRWEWLQLMDYIVENSGRQIKIGLDLTVGYLGYTRMTEVLKRYLEYNRFITIEAFDPATDYDLIVTNNPISHSKRIPVYYLKYDLDLTDLANIRQMIYGDANS